MRPINAGDIVVYDSMLSSNLPREDKSTIRKWFERVSGMPQLRSRRDMPEVGLVEGGLNVVRAVGEGITLGAVAGAIHGSSDNGLDIGGKIPADAALGSLLAASAVLAPDSELTKDAVNMAGEAFAIFAFRKTTSLMVEKRLASGGVVPKHLNSGSGIAGEADDIDSDPVVKTARGF